MKNLTPLLFIFITTLSFAQPLPDMEWNWSYGGTLSDYGYGISTANDGDLLIAGCDGSVDGDILDVLHGGYCDMWFAKILPDHTIQKKRLLDGTGSDVGRNIFQLADGGYIVGGGTNSPDLAFAGTGAHGDFDFSLTMLDGDSMKKVWGKCYGGISFEDFGALQITSDNGFVMCGGTLSNNGDVSGNHGSSDYWVVKTDASGNIQWKKCYGSTGYDKANDIKQTADGGYIVVGFTDGNNGDVHGNHSADYDAFIVKLNSVGDTMWSRCYGGSSQDAINNVVQLSDGSYMMAGYAYSNDGDISFIYGDTLEDGWLVKLDANGNLLWSKTYGGSTDDEFSALVADDGGAVNVAGYSQSNDGTVSINQGSWDGWILRIDADGIIIWDTTYGGKKSDVFYDITATTDNGLAAIGFSFSDDGDVSWHWGSIYYADYWVVKLNGFVGINELKNQSLAIYPSPAHDKIVIDGISTKMDGENISIWAMDGRKMQEQIISTQKNVVVNISALPSGFYFAKVESNSGNFIGKFVKK
jgi:hypothetical protein